MKKYLLITADVNDADYIDSRHEITDEEIEKIMPIIKLIKAYNEDESIKQQKWNWYTCDNYAPHPKVLYDLTDEEYEMFTEYLPSMDNESIHTIEDIRVITVIEEKVLL